MARRETQESITAWADETFGIPETNLSVAKRAMKELKELITCLEQDDQHPKAKVEIADVDIVLARLAERLGADRQTEINLKMEINRKRKWVLDGNGHGQHVEE